MFAYCGEGQDLLLLSRPLLCSSILDLLQRRNKLPHMFYASLKEEPILNHSSFHNCGFLTPHTFSRCSVLNLYCHLFSFLPVPSRTMPIIRVGPYLRTQFLQQDCDLLACHVKLFGKSMSVKEDHAWLGHLTTLWLALQSGLGQYTRRK